MKRVCEADARPLPKQRVKGHKPDVANKINNTINASKASNAIPNNTNAQASCNALETMQARQAIIDVYVYKYIYMYIYTYIYIYEEGL